ncbi:ATP-binding protein [Actinoallomurus sp. CA-142502]|uniref:ATP-binding protein n=1 Tax=Actinoallomurus sp. CA-142502 TaxID=3239885 RepID=UPI003D8F585D
MAHLGRPLEVRVVAGGFAGPSKPRIPRTLWCTDLIVGSANGSTWRRLSTASTNPVKTARGFVGRRLSRVARTDREHVDDVTLAASELVTNAICHAAGNGPFWIGIAVRPRWTHLYVIDADRTVPKPTPRDGEGLSLSGRGVPIVESLGLLWFVAGVYGKTAHAVIPRTGETLTDNERGALMRLAIV